ncbi:hypothetical protein PV797_06270 [Clostridiaceae bacterium M8S5]|nr:hypothetical protein PV797_06270 [Clostridiaceae bacterium M8S5]
MKQTIVGIKVEDRNENVPKVQSILTDHGCMINTRLGIHEAQNQCSPKGLILLEIIGEDEDRIEELQTTLSEVEGVKVQKMTFS